MKKLIISLISLTFLFGVVWAGVIEMPVTPAVAQMGVITIGGGVPSGGDCDFVGNAEFGYNGEHTSGDVYGCEGSSEVVGTESAGGIVTANDNHTVDGSNAVEVNAANEYLSFSKTNNYDYFHIVIWFKAATTTGYNRIFDAKNNSSNYVYIRLTAGGYIQVRHRSTNAVDFASTNQAFSDNTWTALEIIISNGGDLGGAGEEIAMRLDYNGDGDFDDVNEGWEYEGDGDDLVVMALSPTTFLLGDLNGTITDTVFIDDVTIDWTE